MSSKPRVIVIGAGPVGLYTAHALAKANIDYVVLEQQKDVAFHKGAGIVLFPASVRLVDQLGLYDRVEKLSTHLNSKINTLQDGTVIVRFKLFEPIEEKFGYPSFGFSRREMIQVLYDTLPERETRIRTNARLVDIETHDKGVRVRLSDGTVEEGSLVIGADGVHSRTREIMGRLIRESTDDVDGGKAYPMIANFKAIFGRTPVPEHLKSQTGLFAETHGTGVTSQAVIGKEFIYYCIIRTLPKPTTGRRRFTDQELEEEARRYFDLNLFPKTRYEDLWAATTPGEASLVHLEEGFVDQWYHNRVVLMGDAIHKMTPMNGMGVNIGMQDATVLVNQLQSLSSSSPDWSADALEKALHNYQSTQETIGRQITDQGAMMTRMVSWSTWFGWFFDRFVTPWLDLTSMALKGFGPLMANSHILEYIPFEGKAGLVPWKNHPKVQA
ncbi:putative dehydrogenase [Hypoxylon trugodes]|uniref:putative dehydrogenase n=1 Tax=Hypoxylon trugodes TaxID=326681 RepID=UPI002196FE82|nr:putative dehydrogenase [Hypoxylon trugodes]KAI1390639.1 putative dehydrogenase [Hypoxylon trugodes]